MKITTSLNELDFLNYYLYLNSQSKKYQSHRKRSKNLYPPLFIFASIYFFYRSNISFSVFFLCLAVVWYFFFPMLNKKYYVWHYTKFVNKNHKEQINKSCDFEFLEDFIFVTDEIYETKLNSTHLGKIIELNTIIFLQFKDNISLILPKNKVENLVQLRNFLIQFAAALNIEYVHNEAWEWK